MRIAILITATITLAIPAASTAQTQCQTYGNSTTCTDWNAVGANIGAGIAVAAKRRRQESFCYKNQDQSFQGTPCSQLLQQTVTLWMADHSKFKQSQQNAVAITEYVDKFHLNPWSYRSYNKAFKALKKEHAIELNK